MESKSLLSDRLEMCLLKLYDNNKMAREISESKKNIKYHCGDIILSHQDMVLKFKELGKWIPKVDNDAFIILIINGDFIDCNKTNLLMDNRQKLRFKTIDKFSDDSKLIISRVINVICDEKFDANELINKLINIGSLEPFEMFLLQLYIYKLLNFVYYKWHDEAKEDIVNDIAFIDNILKPFNCKFDDYNGYRKYFDTIINAFINDICKQNDIWGYKLERINDFINLVSILKKSYDHYNDSNYIDLC